MSFKDLTPEQRQAMAEKSAATRRAKKAEREAATAETTEEYFPEPEIVYGEIPEPEAAAEPEPDGNDPFSLFLISLNAETKELLSLAELREIYAAQVAKAFAEKKAAKKKSAAEQAMHAARMEAGLVPMATREAMETARRNAELVWFTVELPPAGDNGEMPDIGLRRDQKIFLHGHTYKVTRAQADDMRRQCYLAGEHELTFKGQNIRQRKWIMGRAMGAVDRHIPLNEDGSLV